jgi:hypothetical protein
LLCTSEFILVPDLTHAISATSRLCSSAISKHINELILANAHSPALNAISRVQKVAISLGTFSFIQTRMRKHALK